MRYISSIAAEVPVSPDGTLSRVLYRDDRLRIVGFYFDERASIVRGQRLGRTIDARSRVRN